jgi:1,4-alpha-glucan branching enzyme
MKTTTETETEAAEQVLVGGMGAICHDQGVFFRVWAPNAQSVSVLGTFNDWNSEANALLSEENGYWGVNVQHAKAGDEYKFLLRTPSGDLHRNDPYALQLTNSVGNSIVYDHNSFDWQDDAYGTPYWNEMVIYEMHIGTFNAKDKNAPGTFYTAIERLPYLRDLGINAVEVMPPFEFPGSVSWGYNPAFPFAIETDYGGPDAFKAFIKAAHEHGIAVILDVVYNHFGPSDMDLWQFDGWHENDGGGIYFYNDWRSETPWGDTRPDYGREAVRRYILDNAIMWLEEYRVDGLRMDMVPYIRNVKADGNPGNDIPEGKTLIQWINSEIQKKYPYKITIAEDMHSLDSITNSLENDGWGYGSQWDAQFVHPIREVLIVQDDAHRDMESVAKAITHCYNGNAFERIIYTESHDEVSNGQARIAEEIAHSDVNNYFSKKRAALGVALVLTAPGIPMLFQGQPLLEDKWFSDTDPLDWTRLERFNGFVSLHRDLIQLRRNFTDVTRGLSGQGIELLRVDNDKKVIVFHRWKEGGPRDSVVVAMNFSAHHYDDYAVGFPGSGEWIPRFNSDWKGYDEDFSDKTVVNAHTQEGDYDGKPQYVKLGLAPYCTLLFSQD